MLMTLNIFRTGLLHSQQPHEQLIFHAVCLDRLCYLNYSDLSLAGAKRLCGDFVFLQSKISV